MSVKIRIKRNRLYLDIIQGRRHHWESLNMTVSTDPATKKEQMRLADICRAKREMQLLSGEWDLTDNTAGKILLADYLQGLMDKAGSESRKKTFQSLINHLEKFPRGSMRLASVDMRWVEEFQLWLTREGGMKSSTARLYMDVVRQAFNTAVKERILNHSPADNVKNVKAEAADLPTLTVEELKAMAKTEADTELTKDCKRAFLFSCYTGLRVSDLSTLQWRHIEARTMKGRIEHWIKKRQIKTGGLVEEPISPYAWELIKKPYIPMQEEFVFPIVSKSYNAALRCIKRWAKASGVTKDIGWHTARRTFATLGLQNGIDPFTIQRMMGHSNVTMTATYAKSDGIKSAAVSKFENILDVGADEEAVKEA